MDAKWCRIDREVIKVMSYMPAEDIGTGMKAASMYAETGEAPKKLSPVAQMIFNMVRESIDKADSEYAARVENAKSMAAKRWNAESMPTACAVHARCMQERCSTDADQDIDLELDLDKELDHPHHPKLVLTEKRSMAVVMALKKYRVSPVSCLDDLLPQFEEDAIVLLINSVMSTVTGTVRNKAAYLRRCIENIVASAGKPAGTKLSKADCMTVRSSSGPAVVKNPTLNYEQRAVDDAYYAGIYTDLSGGGGP